MPATEASGAATPRDHTAASGRPRPQLLLPALSLNVLIASGTFLVAKRALQELPPLTLGLIRFVLAALVIWPVSRVLRPKVAIAPADRGRLLLLGILAVPLNQGLYLIGQQRTSASHAALLYALTPALVTLFAARQGERIGRLQLLGIALALAGVVTLLVQRGLHFDTATVGGDVIVSLAVVAWALYLALGRGLTRRYGPLVVTAEALVAGTLVFLPIGLWGLRGAHLQHVSLQAWGGVLYLAWLTSGLNYVIWFWGLEHLKPTTVALITNLQPLVTAAMAWLFLHERLPAGFVVSTALVLGGVWIAQSSRWSVRPRPWSHAR